MSQCYKNVKGRDVDINTNFTLVVVSGEMEGGVVGRGAEEKMGVGDKGTHPRGVRMGF